MCVYGISEMTESLYATLDLSFGRTLVKAAVAEVPKFHMDVRRCLNL